MNKVKLGDLVEFQRGYDLPKNKIQSGKYPVITSNGILGYHNEYKSGPSVVIGRSGTTGNPQLINEKFWAHNTTLFIKDFKGNDIKYIYYLLLNTDINKMKSGSNIPTLNRNHLHLISINATTDKILQRRIANTLSNIDNKIELNNKINDEFEAMAKTIYDYWFLQFEFPNEEGKPYKSSGGKMVWNEELKREIPEGWEVKTLYDIADYINGLACQKYRPINKDNILPVIKIVEMHNGITSNTEYVRDDIPLKNIIDTGDILFSWSASLEVTLWKGKKAGLNQHIFKVVPKFYPKYYIYMQLSAYIINFIKIAETRKTTMGHITIDHLKQSKILLPNIKLAKTYDIFVKDLFEKILLNNIENQELTSLRDFLLPLLMNGQVGFKEDKAEE